MVKDINSLGMPPNSGASTKSQGKAKDAEQETAPAGNSQPSSSPDQVELSSQASSLKAAEEVIQNLPEVDEDRVAEVKAALANNSYNIDNQQLADKMLAADSQF